MKRRGIKGAGAALREAAWTRYAGSLGPALEPGRGQVWRVAKALLALKLSSALGNEETHQVKAIRRGAARGRGQLAALMRGEGILTCPVPGGPDWIWAASGSVGSGEAANADWSRSGEWRRGDWRVVLMPSADGQQLGATLIHAGEATMSHWTTYHALRAAREDQDPQGPLREELSSEAFVAWALRRSAAVADELQGSRS